MENDKLNTDSRLNNMREEALATLFSIADQASLDESTETLNRFIAQALPYIEEERDLVRLVSGFRSATARNYVVAKMVTRLLYVSPEIITPAVRRELWRYVWERGAYFGEASAALVKGEEREL